MKYLFIGAHPDDTDLSCGGTMAKLSEEGHKVRSIALSMCNAALLDEFPSAAKILGVKESIHNFTVRTIHTQRGQLADCFFQRRDRYDFVFTHSLIDRHLDHRTVAEESIRIFNKNLISYMQPLNGNEEPNYFVEISEEQLEKKISAILCYKSQLHRPYMNRDFIRSLAIVNGIKCGKLYAEGFKVVRLVQSL